MHNIVYTETANCQDCYRCVRVCPVNAIRVSGGQASIQDELCIKCGTCVRECPQHAKKIRSSLEEVKEILASGRKAAVSIAPSFAAAFPPEVIKKLPTALKKLGFAYVSETAEGAKLITEESFKDPALGNICTACPAVVNYVELYQPQYRNRLIPVVSPMVAHGRQLKKRLGKDWAVIFIGPCAAKKQEALRPENRDAIDGVLTFIELQDWLAEENINPENCQDGEFISYGYLNNSRLFPLQGGMLKTGGLNNDGTNLDIIHLSGSTDVLRLFNIPAEEWRYRIAEPLFCDGGCINGPGFPPGKNIFLKRRDIVNYARQAAIQVRPDLDREIAAGAVFNVSLETSLLREVSEKEIQAILEKTGKGDPESQANCGACGYITCRDNAIAVARGLAEPEMCIRYMRHLAQQRMDRIVETSPNGVVVLDHLLNIIHMNPSFQKMFQCSNAILGKRISYLLDDTSYEKLVVGLEDEYECIKTRYGVKYHEVAYALRDEEQYIGIYSDLSKFKFDAEQIGLIKKQTLEHARELLTHQISFSQEMARFLGKSTAESEELLRRIMDLFEEKDI